MDNSFILKVLPKKKKIEKVGNHSLILLWIVYPAKLVSFSINAVICLLNLNILQCTDTLQNLESLNLNGCQKISDKGIEAITSACLKLKVFSIYWNVRYLGLVFLWTFYKANYTTYYWIWLMNWVSGLQIVV